MLEEQHEQIGVILLPGIPLLPNNASPLHIFEPRYRSMLEDAMRGNKQFAIGRLITEEAEDLKKCVSSTGILVKVIINQELPDGRSVLIVRGESAVQFTRWTGSLPYPIAEYQNLERTIISDTEHVRRLLRESFLCSIKEEPEENLLKITEALESYGDLTGMIDFIAHYSIRSEDERSFYLDELCDSTRASRLLLSLEQ